MDQTRKTLAYCLGGDANPPRQPEHCQTVEISVDGGWHHKTATNLANVAVWTVGNLSRSMDIQKIILPRMWSI